MKFRNDITCERVREVLSYDSDTGIFRWRIMLSSRGLVGNVAGGIKPDGYRRIGIDGGHYLASRLAWLYTHGAWPAELIDHKNNITDDDRIDNLREATFLQNQANRRCANKNGFKGVRPDGNRWLAGMTVNGMHKHIGCYATPEEANHAYYKAANNLYGEFARSA